MPPLAPHVMGCISQMTIYRPESGLGTIDGLQHEE